MALKWLAQLWLEHMNCRNVLDHASEVPRPFKKFVAPDVYSKSVHYTLAKSRLRKAELTFDVVVVVFVLFSGILPWTFSWFRAALGPSAWSMAAFLLFITVVLSIVSLP